MFVIDCLDRFVAGIHKQVFRHLANYFLNNLTLRLVQPFPIQCLIQTTHHHRLTFPERLQQWRIAACHFLLEGQCNPLPLQQCLPAGFNFLDQCVEGLLPLGQVWLVWFRGDLNEGIGVGHSQQGQG